jgi:hypothetical protein
MQEDRKVTTNLVVHYQRVAYLLSPGPSTLPLAGKTVRVHEWEDGHIELHHHGSPVPFSIFFDKNPYVRPAAVVEHKRLGAALAVLQAAQVERDRARLASKTLSLRQRDRIRQARSKAGAPPIESLTRPRDRTSLLGRKADISNRV